MEEAQNRLGGVLAAARGERGEDLRPRV